MLYHMRVLTNIEKCHHGDITSNDREQQTTEIDNPYQVFTLIKFLMRVDIKDSDK